MEGVELSAVRRGRPPSCPERCWVQTTRAGLRDGGPWGDSSFPDGSQAGLSGREVNLGRSK